MKSIRLFLSIALGTIFVSGCIINVSSGVTVTGGCTEVGCDFSEERTPEPFESFTSAGPFNVYFVQAAEQKVLVEGKEEFVGKVLTTVSGDNLTIKLEDGIYSHLVLKVTVFSPDIKKMKTSGSGNLCSEGMTVGDLDVSTSGSGDVRLGTVACDRLTISSSGSGDFSVAELSVGEDAELSTRGSGNVDVERITAAGSLKLSTMGSGSMHVSGSCKDLDASTMGSGDISGDMEFESISRSETGSGRVKF